MQIEKLKLEYSSDLTRGMSFKELVQKVREYYQLDGFEQLAVQTVSKLNGLNLKDAIYEVKKRNPVTTYYDYYDWDWKRKFGEWLADAGCLWESQNIDNWDDKDYEDYADVVIFNGNFHTVKVADYLVITD